MTTATDYSALESRELDALVAERVMGGPDTVPARPWPWDETAHTGPCDDEQEEHHGHDGFGPRGECSHCTGLIELETRAYSTTWEGAGLVLEAMRERGWRWAVYPAASGPAIAATFSRTGKGNRHLEGQAVTAPAPRAVCIAALRAIAAGGE